MTFEATPGAREFVAPFGLRHRHVQSLLAGWPTRRRWLSRRASPLLAAARPEVLDCGDGVRLLGYSSTVAEPRGLVVLLHGWEGSAEASYVLSIGGLLFAAGFSVFRLNFRDHGGTFELNHGLFHSCRIAEVVGALTAVTRAHRAPRTFLVGHSLGGNFALRAAARAPRAGLAVDRVVAVCPVLRPASTMRALEDGWWPYREYFLRRWRRSLLAKAACFPDIYDFGNLRRFPTLTATTAYFVEKYTEYADLDAYLEGYAVTGDVLRDLTVPARVILAADDPVIPIADLADVAPSPALDVKVVARGGHCAFIQDYRLRSWVDGIVRDDLDAHT
jgi:predicted alpha/beta-fold hydrolase